jgi:hypothetical protein
MRCGWIVIAFCMWALPSESGEVRVLLRETCRGGKNFAYEFRPDTRAVHAVDHAAGRRLATVQAYRVEGRRLCAGKCFLGADQVLFQGTTGGVDVVVNRKQYNSFSNPLRWLTAFSGHPYQVDSIRVVAVDKERESRPVELTHKQARCKWEAEAVE